MALHLLWLVTTLLFVGLVGACSKKNDKEDANADSNASVPISTLISGERSQTLSPPAITELMPSSELARRKWGLRTLP